MGNEGQRVRIITSSRQPLTQQYFPHRMTQCMLAQGWKRPTHVAPFLGLIYNNYPESCPRPSHARQGKATSIPPLACWQHRSWEKQPNCNNVPIPRALYASGPGAKMGHIHNLFKKWDRVDLRFPNSSVESVPIRFTSFQGENNRQELELEQGTTTDDGSFDEEKNEPNSHKP